MSHVKGTEKVSSVYLHIPFCQTICSYCDFCKIYYNEKLADQYLIFLEKEITKRYKKDLIETLYIGGGTPSSLNIKQLNKLLDIIKIFNLSDNCEITFECNVENIDEDKLNLLYKNKINRLSFGVQTFNSKHLKFLERKHTSTQIEKIVGQAKKVGFQSINVDLMYGFENQTKDELKKDLEFILSLNINHISTYSLIIEPNTKLYIKRQKNIDEDLDYEMYKLIKLTLEKTGFSNYELSNYSLKGFESKHNLTYWNNDYYYGFGLGASGYVEDERYTNTKNIQKYLSGEFLFQTEKMSLKTSMENEMILGLRKIKGVNVNEFKEKFKKDIFDVFEIESLIKDQKLIFKNNQIYINKKYLYVSNNILSKFLL